MFRSARFATQARDRPSSWVMHRQASRSEAQTPSFVSSSWAHSAFRIPLLLLGHRCNFHSRLQQLQARGDNFLPIFEAVLYDPFAFESARRLKGAAFDCVIGFHDEGVFHPLL